MNTVLHQPEALLGQLDTLADATRLRLVWLLHRHELSVAEMCDILQMPQSTVSRHLKILVDHHWAISRRQATTNLYRIILDDLAPPARQLWQLARQQTEAWPTLTQDQLRLTERLKQRQQQSQSFFATAATQWDQLRDKLYGRSFTTAAILAGLPHDYTVADLGCGTGQLTCSLSPYVAKVIGVDQSEQMLVAARQRAANLDNVELKRGELEAIPIDDHTCDAAMMLVVLTYVPDPAAVLREMARIIKPGGAAVIVDLLQHDREDFHREMGQQWMGFAPQALTRMLADAGFTKNTCTPLPPEPDTTGPALMLARGIQPIN